MNYYFISIPSSPLDDFCVYYYFDQNNACISTAGWVQYHDFMIYILISRTKGWFHRICFIVSRQICKILPIVNKQSYISFFCLSFSDCLYVFSLFLYLSISIHLHLSSSQFSNCSSLKVLSVSKTVSLNCLFLKLFVSQTVCFSNCLSLKLFVSQTVCLSNCLSLKLFVSQTVCLSNCLSLKLFVSHTVCLLNCLSLKLFVSHTVCLLNCLLATDTLFFD